MAQLKRYNGVSWENVGGNIAPKTTQTNSDTDAYSCNYINDLIKTETETINVGTITASDEKYNQTYTLTNIPTGYKFYGVLGFNLQGNNFTRCMLIQLIKASDTTITWGVRNWHNVDAGPISLNVDILYIKE